MSILRTRRLPLLLDRVELDKLDGILMWLMFPKIALAMVEKIGSDEVGISAVTLAREALSKAEYLRLLPNSSQALKQLHNTFPSTITLEFGYRLDLS